MPFDKLDKKAQEAAQNFRPEYNGEAWAKMEALLDMHMPAGATPGKVARKKHPEKWLLLLLFLAAAFLAIMFLIPGINRERNNLKTAVNTNPVMSASPEKSRSTTKATVNSSQGQDLKNANSSNQHSVSSLKEDNFVSGNTQNTASDISQNIENIDGLMGGQRIKLDASIRNGSPHGMERLFYAPDETETKAASQYPAAELIRQQIATTEIQNYQLNASTVSDIKRPEMSNVLAVKKSRQESLKKRTFGNSFSTSISAGPDISAAGIDNVGTAKFLLGAGLGYNVGKRWMVRTGFYTVVKAYGANPSDYHPPVNFWNYYPNLEEIYANCRVNTIPLIVGYSFNENPSRAWFASAGLSSYFMKRETYNYISKTPGGQYQEKSYTIRNKNTHYFSSFRLSAGYQKSLTKRISFTTEPYVDLPVSGIGYGKVKLGSAGLLFSIGIKPFSKK